MHMVAGKESALEQRRLEARHFSVGEYRCCPSRFIKSEGSTRSLSWRLFLASTSSTLSSQPPNSSVPSLGCATQSNEPNCRS
ncbi:hypothetical protein M407DRAFT_174974 [Tulasnella calospora MUT 4182]|uniref:Uncharacterized protein n=1 Tax=Tulasnella calospora MUT 4182 TaxID=1051891 RepID=A0A0C3K732_9AGAM|nr:hypothetical protein M407DRAFT_174974 [Tulasnella calospora MUT 4182]